MVEIHTVKVGGRRAVHEGSALPQNGAVRRLPKGPGVRGSSKGGSPIHRTALLCATRTPILAVPGKYAVYDRSDDGDLGHCPAESRSAPKEESDMPLLGCGILPARPCACGGNSIAAVGPHGSMAQVMARDLATGYTSGRCVPGFGGGRRMKSRGEVRREAKTPQKADGRTAW